MITPVPKPGKDPTIIDNYRGITVTPILGKLFEKLVLLRLLEYMNVEQSDLQFGFTKNLSPTMSSLICSEVINESRMEGKREQDNSPTRQLTDTVFETIHRQILRQFTDTSEDNSPTLLFKVNDL